MLLLLLLLLLMLLTVTLFHNRITLRVFSSPFVICVPSFASCVGSASARHQVPGLAGRGDKSLERLTVSPDGALTAFTLKGGSVAVLDNRTQRACVEVKMNGTARSIAFSPAAGAGSSSGAGSGSSSQYLVTLGGDAEVYAWDDTTKKKAGWPVLNKATRR